MADISKVKIGGVVYNLKDAKSREDLATLLGEHAVEELGAAAWLGVDSSVTENGAGVVTGGKIKEYVDAQVGTIHKFDVVVADTLPTASADTMYKLYLIPGTGTSPNVKIEYITVRSGAEGSYTYAWEKIGDTEVDLSNYVQKTTKVAGIDLQDDITVAEMESALDLADFAHVDSATGEFESQTITGVKASGQSTGSIDVALDQTSTAASLTKANFTPAGSVTGTVTAAGDIEVTIKDAAETTAAALTKADYTPAGNVTGTVSVPSSAALSKSDAGVQISGTVSKPGVSLTSAPQAVLTSVASAGTLPTYEHTGFSGGSLGDASTDSFAKTGLVAAIDTTDTEMLVFSDATTANAVTAQGAFTAAVYGTDTFTQGAMPTFNDGSVANVSGASLDAAPVFIGDKFDIGLTNTNASISATFAGTKAENALITGVNYYKQEIDTAEFTGSSADINATFAGTEAENVLVTGVNYDKATVNATGTKFNPASIELDVGNIVVAAQTIDVSPNK